MKIKLFFTPAGIDDNQIIGKTSVVIDILRATTVAAVALHNGAREIIPMATLGDATGLKQKLDHSSVLLGGEREGQKVDGFDLGNSPFEYGRGVIENKSIILASTNGSAALIRGSEAADCLSCAFVNISSALEKIIELDRDVAVICAGNKGGFSLEDAICGGMLLHRLRMAADNVTLDNDASWVALEMYKKHRDNLENALRQSDHGKFLISLGFEQDITFCVKEDSLAVCPTWQQGRLILKE